MALRYIIFVTLSLLFILLLFISTNSIRDTKSSTITIGLGGDTMLGREVNRTIDHTSYSYPWGDLLPFLRSMDFTLVNLETTFTSSEGKIEKVFNFKADPDKVRTLLEADINQVNLANNHILDFSEQGLLETIAVLDNAGIQHVGAGKNIEAAQQPIIIVKNGISIGIIGYTDNEPTWAATTDESGTNYITIGDVTKIQQAVHNIRDSVDLIIVSIHWGPNMRKKPTKNFQNFALKIIDTGVDIVHGHSAHIFQGIEIYRNKLILYDTGDLVNDYRVTPELRNDHSFLFQVLVKKQGTRTSLASVQLTPTIISNAQVNQATGQEKENILERMRLLSQPFGTVITANGSIIIAK